MALFWINSIIGSDVPESELDMIYISVITQFSVCGTKTSVLPESVGDVLIVHCTIVGVVALATTVAVQVNVRPVLLTMLHLTSFLEYSYRVCFPV